METLLKTLLCISWIVTPLTTLVVIVSIYNEYQYEGSIQQLTDRCKGIHRSWNCNKALLLTILGGSYLFQYYFM